MAKTVFDVLREKIEADKNAALQHLAGGGAKDFAMYKEATGLIRGLETCLGHIEDLSRNLEYEDD
jgi:hypothetical protein|tara:strand:+ start:1292 stop:1486 length:195 start_codon:yes stop_codon:yes gene_type:complete